MKNGREIVLDGDGRLRRARSPDAVSRNAMQTTRPRPTREASPGGCSCHAGSDSLVCAILRVTCYEASTKKAPRNKSDAPFGGPFVCLDGFLDMCMDHRHRPLESLRWLLGTFSTLRRVGVVSTTSETYRP